MTSSHFSSSEERWRLEIIHQQMGECRRQPARKMKTSGKLKLQLSLQSRKKKKYVVYLVISDELIVEVEFWHAATGVTNVMEML